MSTITENRLIFHSQGVAFVAANTTYPADVPAVDAVTSNTNGVLMPRRYANVRCVARVTVAGSAPPSVGVAVYGFVRDYWDAANAAKTTNDASTVVLNPWDHILSLNLGQLISPTTQALSGVNVCAMSANSVRFSEAFYVGGMYERVRLIPVALSGAGASCTIELAFAGGER
jgi:hypothetical protein